MYTVNQILIHLYEANKFCAYENPHFKKIGLVLLDNLVELMLRRMCINELTFNVAKYDFPKRAINEKYRVNIEKYYLEILKYSKKCDFITDDDLKCLEFAHSVRNKFYHAGYGDLKSLEIGCAILMDFVIRKFPDWGTGGLFLEHSLELPVTYESAKYNGSGSAPIIIGPELDCDNSTVLTSSVLTNIELDRAIKTCLSCHTPDGIIERIKVSIESTINNILIALDEICSKPEQCIIDCVVDCYRENGFVIRDTMTMEGAVNLYYVLIKSKEIHCVGAVALKKSIIEKAMSAHNFFELLEIRNEIVEQMKNLWGINSPAEGVALISVINSKYRYMQLAISELLMKIA